MKKPRRPSRVRPQFQIEELEPRLLFSADPLLAAVAGAPCVVTMPQAPEQAAAANAGAFAQTADNVCATAEAPTITQAPREIAFVDLSVDGVQDLIAALAQQQADGRQIEIVTIAAGEDGLAVITRTLAERQNVDAVHLFSHGDAAGLQLGSLRLDAASLHARLGEIAGWAGAFSEQGDLLVYGCNLAGSPAGIALIDSLSLLTGADVAGSTNLTGSAAQGGDWTLEYTAGRIDTALAMNASLLGDWDQVLATVSYQDGVGGYTGTTDTFLDQLSGSNNSGSTTLSAGRATTQNGFQTLIKFEDIIGAGAGQIPQGAIVTNVTLTMYMTASPTFTNPTFSLYRMTAGWSDTATWSSMGDGIGFGEARSSADRTITDSGVKSYTFASNAAMIASVQAWANDPSSNQGWYIFCDDNSSKASFASSENGTVANRPKLTVEYVIPSPPGMDLDANNSSGAPGNNYQGGFTEGGGAVRVTDTDATITAGSTGTMTGMTVTLNNRPNGASELLAATTTGTPIVASYNSGTGVLTLSGSATLAQYQQVLRTVTYNNTSQNPDTADRALTVVLTDAYGQTASATSAISVTAVNNAPTVSTTGTALGYTENAGAVVVDGGVTVADVDNTQLTGATVQLTTNYVNGQDTLSFTDQNGITGVWDAATGTLTLSGTATVAQYQAALRSVTYTNNSEAPSTSARTVRFLVNDGALSSAAATRSITVASVNDAPVATITPTSYSATEQTNLALQGTGLSISDVDAGSASVQATLSVTSGVLTVLAGSSGVTVTNSGTAAVTLTGTLAQINALLAGTGGATITYLQSSNTPPASATLTLGVNDQGNTGTGGARTGSDTATINITAVNDAPTATITPTSYSATEQLNLTLQGTGLSIADMDAGSASVQATLSVTAGILTVAAGSTGVVVSGSGTGTVTLTGTLAQINNLLAGLNSGTITYVMNSDTPPASATLTLGVNDQGNTGTGGPLTAGDTATINITAVNDAPTATITPTSYSATEQVLLALQGTGLSVSDPDAGSSVVSVSVSVASGTLQAAAGSTGAVISGTGTGTVTLTGTLAQINALLAGSGGATLGFIHTSDAPPASTVLTLAINDQGNTGTGGARSGNDTATINITPVNDAPAIVTNLGTSVSQGLQVVLTNIRLRATDPDNTAGQLTYTLTATVSNGVLTRNGVALGLGDTFTQADLDSGLVAYTHDNSVTFSDQFEFTVTDPDGSATGNTAFAITVTSVNTPPTLATNLPATVLEGQSTVITSALLSTQDAEEAANDLVYTLASLPAHGQLLLNGVALGSGDSFTQQDIDNGLLSYEHDGSETLGDTFDFTVEDGRGGVIGNTTFALNVTPVNDAPTATVSDGTVAEGGSLTIGNSLLQSSDADHAAGSLTLTLQAEPTHGVLRLNGTVLQVGDTFTQADIDAGHLVYEHAGGEGAADQFLFSVSDGLASSGNLAIDLVITPVNDAPQAVITQPSYNVAEQQVLLLHGTGLSVGDVDAGASQVQVTLSVVSGVLSVVTGGSGVLVAGSGTNSLVLTGSVADLNALLAGLNGAALHYQVNSNTPPASDTLTLAIDDLGHTGAGGALAASDSVAINITAVNDAPVAVITPPAYSATEQLPLALQGTGLSVSDPDAGNSSVQATLTVAFGTLTAQAGSTGVVVAGSGTGSITLTGTLAQINALLAGTGGATLSYVVATDTPPATDTLTLAINDLGNTGLGGALTGSDSALINITAVNDAPTATITPPSYAATEQVPLPLHGTGLTVSDPDGGNTTVVATVSVVSGQLNVSAGGSGVAVSGSGTSSVTLTGTIAQINALLSGINGATLDYLANTDTPSASDTLTLLLDDQGNGGSGGPLTASDTALISITAVNDAPVATAPPSYSATEQTPLALHGTGLSIGDADAGSSTVQATLSVAFGTLSVNAGSTGVVVAGSGTGSLTLTGTIAQINALLAGNGGATVSYLINGDAPPAADTLTLAIDDQGHAGIGGALSDTATATIAITAVNDAPTATVTVPAYAATEQVPLTLHGTGLSIADVDAGNSIVQATLSVVSGTLTVGPGSTGVAVAGSGTGSVTLTGTIAQINALLAGSGSASVSYVLGSDTPPASDTLTLLVDDMGHEGIGGVLTASDTALINITAVNDAPVATASPSYSATEQTPLALHGTGLSVSDADAGSSPVQATLSVAFGTLSVNAGSTGVVVAGSGTGSLTLTGSIAQINALLAGNGGATVSYLITGDTPPASDTLSLTIDDGVLADTATSTLHITAVNDAPVVTITQPAYAATEQIPLALQGTGLSVSDVDAGNGLVRVLLAVDAGSLFVGVGATGVTAAGSGGSLVVLTGSLAQVNQLLAGMGGATVSYVIDSDTPPALDQLTLAISDLGGSGSGGAQFSQRAVNIVLTAVHDDPRASDDQYSIPPSTPLTLTPGMLLGNDVSPEGMALTLSIVGSPRHGTLTVRPDGSLFYQPVAGFIGTDTFRYVVNDSVAGSNVATVSITVQAPPTGGGPTLPGDSGSTTPTAPGIDNPGGGSGTTPPGNGTGGSSGEGGESPGSGSNDSTPSPEAGAGDQTGPGAGASDDAIVIAPGAGPGGNGSASGQGRGGLQAGYAMASPYVLTGLNFNMTPLDLKIHVSRALDVGTLVPVQLTLNDNASLLADGLKLLREDTESGQLPLVQLSAAQLQTVGSMLSIGAVWWAARGATLLTSLLVTTPIWRTMDPLPVLSSGGPDDDDEGSAFGEDGEAERMFEEPPAADPAHADIG